MRTDMIKLAMHNQAFIVDPIFLAKGISVLNDGAPQKIVESTKSNAVTYEEMGNVAIISVDGAMYKRSMSGACGETVASYSDINKYIIKAESSLSVDTTLFLVDTPGGSVAGANQTESLISNSMNRTITLYDNQATSGGMYVFHASDEVFATENTILGSVGVLITFFDSGDKNKLTYMTSKNAKNKVCDMENGCAERIQAMIDVYEDTFYAKLIKNSGKTAEQIRNTFDEGATIMAEAALDAGFIDGIMTVQQSINRALKLEATPIANSNKSNLTKGV